VSLGGGVGWLGGGRAGFRGLFFFFADLEAAPRPTFDHIVAAQQLRNGADHYE